MTRIRKSVSIGLLIGLLFLAAALAPLTPPVLAGQSDTKESFKKLGRKMKELGEKVGEAGKEAGEEIAEVAKKVFYKGKKVSEPLLKKTQKATRDFWDDVISGKNKAAEELQDENEKLKRELEEEE